MRCLEDYIEMVGEEIVSNIHKKARHLYGKHIVHINSTYQGGGVAEMLSPLMGLMNDIGVDAGWRVLHGNQDFFTITKKFHNALQGANLNFSEKKKRLYTQVNENFSIFTHIDHDCVVVHDPQPLPLIKFYKKRQPWIWRCHIDLTETHQELWNFLKEFILKYDMVIFSSEKYIKADLPVEQRLMVPAIDPLSLKNQNLSDKDILKYAKKVNIPNDKPIITQVSRLDPWKDPEGLLDVFKRVKENVDCRLLYCYNIAMDDPESVEIYSRIYRKAKKFVENGDVLFVMGNSDVLVNAVQRYSTIIVQKSIREGFCLAVTEALWKGKPVVASNVGGIPLQIKDGENGFLLDRYDIEGFADRIVQILRNPDMAEEMGRKGKEIVREKYLITRLLSDHLDIMNEIVT